MIEWINGHHIEIVFFLSCMVIVVNIVRWLSPSYKKSLILVGAYLTLLVVGISLLGLFSLKEVPSFSDVISPDPKTGGSILHVMMMAVYFFTLVIGYIASARFLVYLGAQDEKSLLSANVKLYLLVFPLFFVALIFNNITKSVSVYIYLLWVVYVIVRNCMLMKHRWYIALLIAVMGITAGIAAVTVFVNIIFSVIIIVVFFYVIGGLAFGKGVTSNLLGNSSFLNLNNGTGNGQIVNNPNEKGYDVVINGGGPYGEDIGANRNADGSLTDSLGRSWSNDGYNNYHLND